MLEPSTINVPASSFRDRGQAERPEGPGQDQRTEVVATGNRVIILYPVHRLFILRAEDK
jgi:hypothetical protein